MSKQDRAVSDDIETPEQPTTDSDANATQPPTQQEEESSNSGSA